MTPPAPSIVSITQLVNMKRPKVVNYSLRDMHHDTETGRVLDDSHVIIILLIQVVLVVRLVVFVATDVVDRINEACAVIRLMVYRRIIHSIVLSLHFVKLENAEVVLRDALRESGVEIEISLVVCDHILSAYVQRITTCWSLNMRLSNIEVIGISLYLHEAHLASIG